MDEKFIKNAAELFRTLDLSELQIRDGNVEIHMKRNATASLSPISQSNIAEMPAKEEPAKMQSISHDYKEIKAPLLGYFT